MQESLRIAYVKSSNVAAETALAMSRNQTQGSGHESLVQHFLRVAHGPSLLLSQVRDTAGERFARGMVAAKTLPRSGRLTNLVRLFKELVDFRPDVSLCAEMELTLLAVRLASALLRRPYVAACHNRLHGGRAGLARRLADAVTAHCLHHAAACICHGPFLRRQLMELGIPAERIIEFDWNFNEFKAASSATPRQDLTDGGKRRVIAFLGRVVAEKGVFDLLEALAGRLAQDPTLRLAYIGDGEALPELTARIASLGLADSVVLLGRVPYLEVPALLRQAAVVTTPTRSTFPEGHCMANLEALALGLPSVVPNFGPFPFNIRHDVDGLLFSPDSPADLRAKLSALLDDPQLLARLTAGAKAAGEQLAPEARDLTWAMRQAIRLATPPAAEAVRLPRERQAVPQSLGLRNP